jgi:hypothetical protein
VFEDTETTGTGTTGAKRTSWEHYNPRDLLLRLVRDYPNADDKTLARHLRDCVLGDDQEYLLPILLYFVRNNKRALEEPETRVRRMHVRDTEKHTRVAQIRNRLTEHVREEAERILLDLEMPNGKPLRDCTGRDCARFGGWYQRLADRVGPRKLVGNVLSEQDVRKFYKAA